MKILFLILICVTTAFAMNDAEGECQDKCKNDGTYNSTTASFNDRIECRCIFEWAGQSDNLEESGIETSDRQDMADEIEEDKK